MKIWKFMLMSLVCAMAMVSLSACGGDDNDNNNGGNVFVGTWEDEEYGDYYILRSNGTGSYNGDEVWSFTYEASGNTARLMYDEGDTERLTYHDGNIPYLTDEFGDKFFKR